MLDTRHPFTRADALAAGFTPKQLRGARFRRLFHGVYGLPVRREAHEHVTISRVTERTRRYPEWKVAIEYDGRHHINREGQWRQDLDRREELETDGWRVLVITSEDIYREPARTIGRVQQALKARGAELPVRARGEWRAHFWPCQAYLGGNRPDSLER